MKHALVILLMAAAAILPCQPATAQTDTITIIHVNDTHSALAPIGPRTAGLEGSRGGIARAATLIKELQGTSPNPIFLHGGDLSIGDLFYNFYHGIPEYRILSSLGCRGMAVGNHEFDLGPEVLLQTLDSTFAGGGVFPLLSANIRVDDPAVRGLRKYIRPYTIVRAGSSRIGIFGLTTPATMTISSPGPVIVDTPFAYAAAMVETLAVRGCNVVVCLSHLGLALDEVLCRMVPGINVIVGAHDHYALDGAVPAVKTPGDTTWIVQANSAYLDVGKLQLICGKHGVRLMRYQLLPVDSAIVKDPVIDRVVDGLIAGIERAIGPVFTQPIASSTGLFREVSDSLSAVGYKDTPIGNLVTDAFRNLTKTQIALEPGGSTAMPIFPGPLVADDLFRVVGYGFNRDNGLGYHLVRVTMSGAALTAGLEFGLSDIESNDEYFLQTSGLEYEYDGMRAAGSRVVAARVNGTPLHPDSLYTVTANYFVKTFLESLSIPYQEYHEFTGDTTEFMALTRYVIAQSPIAPSSPGRILSRDHEKSGLPENLRLEQIFPNPIPNDRERKSTK